MKFRSKRAKEKLKLESRWTGSWRSWERDARRKGKTKRLQSPTAELDPVAPKVEAAASAATAPPSKSPRGASSRSWKFPKTSPPPVESQSAVFLPVVLLPTSFHLNLSLMSYPPSDPAVSIETPSSLQCRKTMHGCSSSWTTIFSEVRGEWPLARFWARPWQVQPHQGRGQEVQVRSKVKISKEGS